KTYYLPADLLPPEKKEEYQRRALDNIWDLRIRQARPERAPELKIRRERGELPEDWEKDLWRWDNMMKDDLASQLQNGMGFQIIPKPPAKILDMRRPVFDYDHRPDDLKGIQRDRWEPDDSGGWRAVEPNVLQASPKPSRSWVRYQHVLRPDADHDYRGKKPELITDFMSYNSYEPHRGGSPPQPNWVGDLLVECEVAVEQPTGTFTLELSKGVDRFRAAWDLAAGKCSLHRLNAPHTGSSTPEDDTHYVELANKPTKLQGKGTHRVRFANIDNRLLVWMDDDLPFEDGVN